MPHQLSTSNKVALATAGFTALVMVSQFIFSAAANGDISNHFSPCHNVTGSEVPNLQHHNMPGVFDWMSALAFLTVTFPPTVFYLDRDVARFFSRNSRLTDRQQYYLDRYNSNQKKKRQLVQNGLVQVDEEVPLLNQPVTEYNHHTMRFWHDILAGIINIIPLIIKIVLALLYGFHSFSIHGRVAAAFGYPIVLFGMVLKAIFRFDSTFKAGVELKDLMLKHQVYFAFNLAGVFLLALMAAPYGFYASETLLNGAVSWMLSNPHHPDVCRITDPESRLAFYWISCIAYALPALEKIKKTAKTIYKQTVLDFSSSVKSAVSILGVYWVPVLALTFFDLYCSGWYYSRTLLSDYLHEHPTFGDGHKAQFMMNPDMRAGLYVFVYGFYYSWGNIATMIDDEFQEFFRGTCHATQSFFGCCKRRQAELNPPAANNPSP